MLSRVAESIYWIGRYTERAENVARLINVNSNLILDLPKGLIPDCEPLITILGCEELYHQRHPEITERRIVNFLISDETNPESIISCLSYARENARTIREILPREGWEKLNSLYNDAVETKSNSYARSGRRSYLENIINNMQLMTGLLAGTMNHDMAYDFLNLGRKIERADMTTRIIDVRSENMIPNDAPELNPFEDILWMSMLKSMSAYQMYRQSMQAKINRKDVMHFLFMQCGFPRSVCYCVKNMERNLNRLTNNNACLSDIENLNQTLSKAIENTKDNNALHDYIDNIQLQLANIHNNIQKTYFPSFD